MKLIFCFLTWSALATTQALATPLNVTVSWDIDTVNAVPGVYGASSNRTWATFDIDGAGPLPLAPHLQSVVIAQGNPPTDTLGIWDDPSARQVTNTIDVTAKERITLRQVFYEGGPWLPGTAYALGDKINVGDFPSVNYWWQCTRAGSSGSTEPVWPDRVQLTSGNRYFFDGKYYTFSGEAVNNGSGTVNIPATAHRFVAGDNVTITGTTNYNGTYTLPTQAFGTVDAVEITHAYVAETFASPAEIHISAGVAVDNLDGTVTIPVPAHGFSAGAAVTIYGSPYAGPQTLPAQTQGDADHMVITATYTTMVSDQASYAYPTNGNLVNNGSTVTLPAIAHGLVAGDTIDISGTSNYSATSYTLPVQTNGDADHIEITATYVAESLGPTVFARKRVQDPNGSGAEWKFTTGTQLTFEGTPTGRILVKDNGTGQAVTTGTSYLLRAAP
ncbi:MAG: hypothetical protein PHI06_09085 [Desulfobulbaceae bacterium]|nr:hypothetical protein [Desulfobulbaceae bacterium]